MTVTFRKLSPSQEAAVEAFLAETPETTLFLRSNLERAGLVDDGRPFSGTWVGAFDGERLASVATHFWNGNLVISPGPDAEAAAVRAAELSGRAVTGLLGRHEEVVRARGALGMANAAARFTSREILYTLRLAELRVPAAIADGRVVVRTPHPDELGALLEWRMEYSLETTATPDTAKRRAEEAAHLVTKQDKDHHFVVTADGERVAYCTFNAAVADLVQIGGVWTPHALRSRGYARCVVAGSLQHARDRGVQRAVLFTGETNVPAQRAYVAIGFQPIGDYGIVLFG